MGKYIGESNVDCMSILRKKWSLMQKPLKPNSKLTKQTQKHIDDGYCTYNNYKEGWMYLLAENKPLLQVKICIMG